MRDTVSMVNDVTGAAVSESQPVKSAERTIHILETLAASPTRMSLGELQEACGYPRSSLHALLRTLKELRWIEADETGSRYGIGTHALLTGTSYLDKDSVVSRAAAVLEALRSDVRHTVHFARRDEDSVIYLASRGSKLEVRRMHRVGRKLPCHVTALGQALLAELTTDEVTALLPEKLERYTENTIVDRDALIAELGQVRRRGWSLEQEQGTVGVVCIATVVPYRIPATDALSVSMPAEVASYPGELERIAGVLTDHAAAWARELRAEGVR
ncbi:IclR family transcriptional regulator [Rhodococcoides yunnanense]|uniref:IclR family transcriptional regulator n=1 Tax=Rhodococcoides yunnanense TaxID=278209 RepID=A0ABU4B7S7_9NOCA|nr:IclR family transcriptional regulator [Rhodococcus yunnanensis]MDV6260237.1 IclR family transcriptional regulator [Rhodococcus yunnanensis]